MEVTKRIIDHVLGTKFEDIPKRVIDVQKKSLFDSIGVMAAATTLGAGCSEFIEFAANEGGNKNCTVVGAGFKTTPEAAALANGALAHALDFEDSSEIATLHPNAVPIATLLPIAEMTGASGKDYLAASAIASDLACRFSLCTDEDLVPYGWYMPPVHGSMAAVMAACRLLGLSYEKTLDAIAMNLYQATGSSEVVNSRRSVMRSVRDGFGARAAMLSAILAKRGICTGFEAPFEGKNGYFRAYSGEKHNLNHLTDDLGVRYIGAELSFKPWPSCHATHTGIQAIIEIMRENELRFEDILSIHERISAFACSIVMEPREIKNRPQTAINAKFSIPYTLGVAAKYGDVTLEHFIPEKLRNEEIYSFAEKVTYEINPDLTRKEQGNIIDITVKTTKGIFARHMEKTLGGPDTPLSDELFEKKFRSCMKYAKKRYSEEQVGELIEVLRRVETLEDIHDLTRLF